MNNFNAMRSPCSKAGAVPRSWRGNGVSPNGTFAIGKIVFATGGAGANRQARSAQQAGEGAARCVALAVDLADLRRELDAVCRQRDILKKALAIVAQESPHALR